MNSLWRWLSDNSSSLLGLAAVVGMLSTVWFVFSYMWDRTSADITVRYGIEGSTLPPEIDELLKDVVAMREFSDLAQEDFDALEAEISDYVDKAPSRKSGHSPQIIPFDRVLEILTALSTIKNMARVDVIDKLTQSLYSFSKYKIQIVNNTDSTVSGIRFRLNGVYRYWGVNITSTFLTNKETRSLERIMPVTSEDNAIVSPAINNLPAQSPIQFNLYGDFSYMEPNITTPGLSYTAREIKEIEMTWFIDMINSGILWFFAPSVISLAALLLLLVWMLVRKYVINNVSGALLYNAACKAALDKEVDVTMFLLRQAVTHGYRNHKHMAQDEDLKLVRDRQDFKDLLAQMAK